MDERRRRWRQGRSRQGRAVEVTELDLRGVVLFGKV